MTDFPPLQRTGQCLDAALISAGKGHDRNEYEEKFNTSDSVCLQVESQNGLLGQSVCSCQQNAILILEELEVKRRQKTAVQYADLMLVARRRSLVHCETMLGCSRCTLASSSVMLTILICEKIIATLQMSPTDEASGGGGASSLEFMGKNVTNKRFDRHITLGEYQINTEHEWGRVVDLLTSFQLKRLKGLLARLRSVVETGGWDSLLDTLQSHESTLGEILKSSAQ